jgi:hypothetical protein
VTLPPIPVSAGGRGRGAAGIYKDAGHGERMPLQPTHSNQAKLLFIEPHGLAATGAMALNHVGDLQGMQRRRLMPEIWQLLSVVEPDLLPGQVLRST